MSPNEFKTGVIKPVECFKEGWELIKSDYWLLFGITIVGLIIGGMSMYILVGAMICGIYYCYLQKFDGKTVTFDGLFKGFNYFLPSLLVTIIIIVPMFIFIGVIYVPLIMAGVMGSRLSESELLTFMGGTIIVELIFAIFMVSLQTLLMFAFPLIVDRNLSAGQAIKTSAKAVWKNLSGVVGLFAVGFVIALVGQLALCVGVYFVVPILLAGNLVAYRKVFPPLNPQDFNNPPAPGAFSGAGNYN